MSTGPPACGWLRGTSRTSPGPPCRWRRPVRLRSTSARGRGFAAYLSACGGQPLQRPRCGLRQGGASLTTFGFVTTVPRYLPVASNSLTFVRGADRACCAPRKWLYCLICAPLKWSCRPTDALPVLVVRTPPGGALACAPGSGTLPPAQMVMQTDRCLACTGCPHAPRRGIGVRTRQRHLAARACVRRVSGDAALFMYCISGDTDRPCFARASRRTPPGGALACALGGGILPPRR